MTMFLCCWGSFVNSAFRWQHSLRYADPGVARSLAVQSGGRTSAFFPVDSGVRQGCVLAPTLFNACLGWVLGRIVGSSGCRASVGEERFTDLDFANDAVILAESMEALIGALERLSEESRCLGLRVSWIKTKIQAFNDFLGTAISRVSVCGENVSLVERYTYLGSDIHVSGDSSYEVSRQIGRTWGVMRSLERGVCRSRYLCKRTKVQVFRVLVLPVLLYGCETWMNMYTTKLREHSKLDAMHILPNV
uniref:Reverse transcriptase domain-containing protein n=1 Tax=Paramormyrops kingsleyae TaxID=1676925 RepID=A0A3B3R059_9TELE